MLLDVLYRWDVSSFFQKVQRSSLNNNPLFQYKYIALYLHYVGRSKHNKQQPTPSIQQALNDIELEMLFKRTP